MATSRTTIDNVRNLRQARNKFRRLFPIFRILDIRYVKGSQVANRTRTYEITYSNFRRKK